MPPSHLQVTPWCQWWRYMSANPALSSSDYSRSRAQAVSLELLHFLKFSAVSDNQTQFLPVSLCLCVFYTLATTVFGPVPMGCTKESRSIWSVTPQLWQRSGISILLMLRAHVCSRRWYQRSRFPSVLHIIFSLLWRIFLSSMNQ